MNHDLTHVDSTYSRQLFQRLSTYFQQMRATKSKSKICCKIMWNEILVCIDCIDSIRFAHVMSVSFLDSFQFKYTRPIKSNTINKERDERYKHNNTHDNLINKLIWSDLYYERIRSNLYYITGMGESTNGSDLYYWEQYKHSNTHDNLIYESINKWIRSNKQIQWNWSDSNRYCTYFICHHNTQQATSTVRTVSIHH